MDFLTRKNGVSYTLKRCRICGKLFYAPISSLRRAAKAGITPSCKECGIRSTAKPEFSEREDGGGLCIIVKLPKDHPFYSMTRKRRDWVKKHRLVMATHLGRPLREDEYVFHKDGNYKNNELDNLELLSLAEARAQNRIAALPMDSVVESFKLGISIKTLAERHGVCERTIRNRLKKAGVEIPHKKLRGEKNERKEPEPCKSTTESRKGVD